MMGLKRKLYSLFKPKSKKPHWQALEPPEEWHLPLKAPATVRWNAQCVPYVIADSAHDAAVLCGAVSYLLRGNQIQLFRSAAWGRLAELGSWPLIRIDTMIRSLDLHRAQDDILLKMPPETLAWIEGYCAGLNAVAAKTVRNREARLLGIRHDLFNVRDILAIGRLTGTDVNWPMLFDLLPLAKDSRFSSIWQRLVRAGSPIEGLESGASSVSMSHVSGWLMRANRSGSNCIAIHASRSATGKPLLASDPHLNHQLPNLWLLMGIQCPQIQAVGLMFPGVPLIGLGRNQKVAWGGTNLRAYSSDMVVLNDSDLLSVVSFTTAIKVRWLGKVKRTLRHSSHGPIISDHVGVRALKIGAPIALRWAGHWSSDEFTAFLNLMRSRVASDLKSSMSTYAVTGLNVLAADVDGNIAQTHAAWLPRRSGFSVEHCTVSSEHAFQSWSDKVDCHDLPWVYNPSQGFIASTNQDPRAAHAVSWYFNGEERNRRLSELVLSVQAVTADHLKLWHGDSVSKQARIMSEVLLQTCQTWPMTAGDRQLLNGLSGWDGNYRADSRQALLFEAILAGLHKGLLRYAGHLSDWWVLREWAYICNYLLEDCERLPVQLRGKIWRLAAQHARRMQRRFVSWGKVHRLAPRHVLGGLPWVGRRWFPSLDLDAAGSRETLMKNAHGWVTGGHRSEYGAQARQLCDLSDPDANWFVLLGGQDERVQSPHALDQSKLWAEGVYVQLPLTQSVVESQFPRHWAFSKAPHSS